MKLTLTKKYAVYVDYTCESIPRPFYVGVGTVQRCNSYAKGKRNLRHHAIKTAHGIHRLIEFESDDHDECFERERKLILTYKTYARGGEGWWGANYDLGGMGGRSTPKTLAHREKIRLAHTGKHKSPEHCLAMSLGGRGKILTQEHRAKISESGRKASTPEMNAARSSGAIKANKKRWSKPMTDDQRSRFRAGAQKRVERQKQEGFNRSQTSEATKQKISARRREQEIQRRLRTSFAQPVAACAISKTSQSDVNKYTSFFTPGTDT